MNNAAEFIESLNADYDAELKSKTEISVVTQSTEEVAKINKILTEKGAGVYQISAGGGLEEWFMELTKQN